MKTLFKSALILSMSLLFFSCSEDTKPNEQISSIDLSKSLTEDFEITANEYIQKLYNESPILIQNLKLIDEQDHPFFLSKYEVSSLSNSELFATVDIETNSIKLFIEVNWSLGYASITDVYWHQTETFVLGSENDITQELDLMEVAQQGSLEAQAIEPKFRNRGFGWTCGDTFSLSPDGGGQLYRTCCHRLFWRLTQDCKQSPSDELPGRNPRIVSLQPL